MYLIILTSLILDLLRVIKNGLTVKDAVDHAIDQCAELVNLRDSIEEARINAEQATSEQQREMYARRGNTTSHLARLPPSSFRFNFVQVYTTCEDTSSLSSSNGTYKQ